MTSAADTSGSSDPSLTDVRLTPVAVQKEGWRTRLLAARAERSEEDQVVAARALQAHLLAAVADAGWSTISAYVPFGDEPGSAETLVLLQDAGVRILLPRTGPEDLTWAVYDGTFRPGRLGIPEPTGEDLGLDGLTEAEAVLAPALAVDRNGTRIGYGRGYYDRALSRLPADRPVLAVVYDDEVLDLLPSADYDRPVTHTVTPLLGTRPIGSVGSSL
ncbi:MAG: 5-formyltetrahydrofolate cyclo-ligase [Geodermatophilaceae bacterium]|nr:5-formyltetrahydrofolate cyclo-ligase [Geodermatophilaceae bacterium]